MMTRLLILLALTSIFLASCSLVDERSGARDDDDEDDDQEQVVVITLLAAYTSDAASAAPDLENRIAAAVAGISDIYRSAELDVRLDIVHLVEVDYEMTSRLEDLSRLMADGDGHLDEVHGLRDEHEADIVALIVNRPRATINGSIMATPETAFVVVHYGDLGPPSYGLAHEIGHLHGARHSVDDDPANEPFPYGHGFKTEDYRTIMANGRQQRVPLFANPDLSYDGQVMGDAATADVVRVIRETAAYLSNFRGEQTPTDFVPPGHWPTVE